jgi:hypothetical protein
VEGWTQKKKKKNTQLEAVLNIKQNNHNTECTKSAYILVRLQPYQNAERAGGKTLLVALFELTNLAFVCPSDWPIVGLPPKLARFCSGGDQVDPVEGAARWHDPLHPDAIKRERPYFVPADHLLDRIVCGRLRSVR